MEVEFEGTHDRIAFLKTVRAVTQRARRMHYWRVGWAVVVLTAGAWLTINFLNLYGNLTEQGALAFGIVLFLFLPLTLWRTLSPLFTALGAAEKLWKEPTTQAQQRGTITATGIEFRTGAKPRMLSWKDIAKVHRADDVIGLLTDAQEVSVFPRAFFKRDGDWAKFRQWVDAYVMEAK